MAILEWEFSAPAQPLIIRIPISLSRVVKMAQKRKSGKKAPKDVDSFNWGVGRIFAERKIPLDKNAAWLVRWRSPSRVASAYLLALNYCRNALGSEDCSVVAAARKKGDAIAEKSLEFLALPKAKEISNWNKLEAARDAYLNARGKGAVPAKKGRESQRKAVPKKQEPSGELGGTKISKAEPSKEELEATIAKVKSEMGRARRQYYSYVEQVDWELEEFIEDETGIFTSREDVLESDEYKKRKRECAVKRDAALEKWLESKEKGGRRIAELEDKIETLYWTQEQRKKKIWEYADETLDARTTEHPWRTMVYRLRKLIGGGLSKRIVGCKNDRERGELDKYLLSALESGTMELSSHEGLSNGISEYVRLESAEAIGMIRPNDEWVNRRLIGQLRKYEKSDIVRGEISLAVGRIAQRHKNAKIKDGGKLRDEATDILLGILAEGEKPSSDNELDISFRRRMFVKSLIALGKTAKGTKKEREAIDALAKAAIESPTPLASIAAAASIAKIGGKYAKKKLKQVREEMGLPEVSRLVEISDAYENRNMETAHLDREVEMGIMGPDADFSKLVPPGKTRREMVFGTPRAK
jgi:hypothetical protein